MHREKNDRTLYQSTTNSFVFTDAELQPSRIHSSEKSLQPEYILQPNHKVAEL